MSAWILPAIIVGFLAAAMLVPLPLMEELLRHLFLLVREPFVILRDWSRRGFRTIWLWLKSGFADLGLSRRNWARRTPLLLFLGVSFFISIATFVLNLIPTFAGLFGHGDDLLRHLPLSLEALIAVELAVATLSPGILLCEVLGITRLGSDWETIGLRPVTKGLLAAVLAALLAGAIVLTYDSGLVRASGFAFDPSQNQPQSSSQVPDVLLGPSFGSIAATSPSEAAKALPARASDGQNLLGEQFEGAATRLLTWIPVLSLASAAVAFMAFPHTMVMLGLVPILVLALLGLGLMFLVGESGERLVNAGYNLAHACVGVLGHVGNETRRVAGRQPAATPGTPAAPASVASASATKASTPTVPNTVVAGAPVNSGATTASDTAAAGPPATSTAAPSPSTEGTTATSESTDQGESLPSAGHADPAQMWNPLGIDSKEEA